MTREACATTGEQVNRGAARRLAGAFVALLVMVTAAAPADAAPTHAVATRIPVPAIGSVYVKSLPYSKTVPGFPTSVPGYTKGKTRRYETRVFQGVGPDMPIPGFNGVAANDCDAYQWFVRWRSANPDVTVKAAAYMAGDYVAKTSTGGAGYIAGGSCYGPTFIFGRALHGNGSNLADVYYEVQFWIAKPARI